MKICFEGISSSAQNVKVKRSDVSQQQYSSSSNNNSNKNKSLKNQSVHHLNEQTTA